MIPEGKPAERPVLIRNGTVVTLGAKTRVLKDMSILISGGRIRKLGEASKVRATKGEEVIDAGGRLVLPGFINSHMHFYSTLARGMSKAKPAKTFNEVLENLWWRLDRKLTLEDTYYSALIPLIDAIRKGTTTIIDHHASPGAVEGSLEAIARAVREVGLRASLCYEVSDRDGAKVAAAGIRENAAFIKACASGKDEHFQALFGLHASFTLGKKTLEQAVQTARDLGAGFHVHCAEALSDQEHCVREHKMRVVERFHKAGLLGPKTICAHCVHVSDREMELLAETRTAVVHNPQSNMNNAVGTADVVKLASRGVLVGLGTDAMTVDMPAELRAGVWAQKLKQKDPSQGFLELATTLTRSNAIIADRYWNLGLGEIREGAVADVIILDYIPPTPMTSDNFLGHLTYGAAEAAVDTTIASGRVLMKDKVLCLDIDERAVAAKARELAQKLWRRF